MIKIQHSNKEVHNIFVSIEGLDGSGKSTQALILKERITKKGFATHIVSLKTEPWFFESLPILNKAFSTEQEIHFFANAWNTMGLNIAKPLYNKNISIIADRYIISFLTFQSFYGKTTKSLQKLLNPDLPMPDMTFILNLPIEESQIRSFLRINNESEKKKLSFNFTNKERQLHAQQVLLTKKLPGNNVIVDASGTIEEVSERIWQRMNTYFEFC